CCPYMNISVLETAGAEAGDRDKNTFPERGERIEAVEDIQFQRDDYRPGKGNQEQETYGLVPEHGINFSPVHQEIQFERYRAGKHYRQKQDFEQGVVIIGKSRRMQGKSPGSMATMTRLSASQSG